MKRMRLKINRKLFSNGIKIAFALALSFVLNQFPMDQIEFFAYDLLFRAKANNSTSGEIAIVNIDRNSIEQLRHEPDLTDYTLLMQQLKELSPKAVLFLPDLNRIEANQNQKAAFARSTEEINNFIVSVEDVPLAGAENKFKLSTPLHHINVQPGILSKDSRNFAQDNVSRRALVHYEGHYFAQAQIAQLINPVKDPMDYQGAFPFKGSIQVLVNLHKKGSFNTFSFIDVVDGNINKEDLKNKIIVIGQDAQSEADNYVMTPFLRDVTAMSKAEYNANIIDGLIKDNSIIQTSEDLRAWLCFLISLITVYITAQFRPTRGILSLLGLATGYFLISLLLFHLEVWIPVAHPLLAIFVGYYLLIPFRLVQENKKSWEYQQKNRLLTQVEELKNNFISMMSHDLKTPLARIQGMAELALNDKGVLSLEQKDALSTISRSSEELSLFVSSILNFGRIESQGVKLKLEANDLNRLVEDVVKKYHYLAKEKNIEIITELEPLFSTPMDTALIRQVVQNLIENAIKYSPENSKVLIFTEEIDGKIQLQVTDQGAGIPVEEHDKVFMKFYRSKNAKSSPIKGTGLGLYLTKYFVDLHQGEIQIDSVSEQGTTFTVNLPTNLEI